MLWAAASLCFFGFMRSSEITVTEGSTFDPATHLGVADLAVDRKGDPQILQVTLKTSKTDPFRKGVKVYVGRTRSPICPVEAILAYMRDRGLSSGPLFRLEDGHPLTRARFVAEVKQILTRAGVCSKGYSGHSFRSGAATTAAARGIEDAAIKMLGRWSSCAYQVYIKKHQGNSWPGTRQS